MGPRFYSDVLRQSVEGLRDAASDTGERVSVTTERHGVADGILVVGRLECADDCRRHGALARDVEGISGADLINRPAEVVAEAVLNL